MEMPVSERRLNIRFITEHLEKLQELQQEREVVTADKPKVAKPGIKPKDQASTYSTTVKKQ